MVLLSRALAARKNCVRNCCSGGREQAMPRERERCHNEADRHAGPEACWVPFRYLLRPARGRRDSGENYSSSSRSTRATETTLSVAFEVHHATPCVARPMVRMSCAGVRRILPCCGDDQQFLVVLHLRDADDVAVLVGDLEVLQAQAATALDAILVEVGALARSPSRVTVSSVPPGFTTSIATTSSPSRNWMPRTP